jgi:hypothetical protein
MRAVGGQTYRERLFGGDDGARDFEFDYLMFFVVGGDLHLFDKFAGASVGKVCDLD